MNLVMVKIYQ